MRPWAACLVLLAGLALMACAHGGGADAGRARVVAPGDVLPPVALLDHHGEPATVEAAANGRPVVLAIFRDTASTDCALHLVALQRAEPDVLKRGYRIVAVGAAPPAALARLRDVSTIRYPLLSDEQGALAQSLGLWSPGEGPPAQALQPALLVARENGLVQFLWTNEDPRLRYPADRLGALLAALD